MNGCGWESCISTINAANVRFNAIFESSIASIVVAANAQLLRRVELRPEALATDASETAEAPDQRVEGTNR